MPLELSDFSEEVQVAFFIYEFLEDKWEGMSGTYFGKIWTTVEYWFNLYEVQEPKTILLIMKMYESLNVDYRSDKANRRAKAEERKSAGGGKNFTHNVKG